MHFLVTGGAGFIGSHLTEQLLAEGHSVTVVDNLNTGSLCNLPNSPHLKVISQDILTCQYENFTVPIDGIAHLAAIPSVKASWLKPLETHHNVLSTTVASIQLCQALNIPRLVFASSAAVYGNPQKTDILSEDLETCPMSPYGLQKLVSEQYANLFAQKVGFSFISLRLFNVFGSRQRADSNYSSVISIFARAMQQNLPITIYGDGSQTRDFVYVQDVVSTFVKALTIPLSTGTCLTCNVGTGNATSINELVELMKTYFPLWKAPIYFALPRTGDIQHSQANIARASSLLGFTPRWSVAAGLGLFVASEYQSKNEIAVASA